MEQSQEPTAVATELREESASKPFESVGDQVDNLVKNLVDKPELDLTEDDEEEQVSPI